MAQISKKEISPHKSLQHISLEEECIETIVSMQKAQPESIVFLSEESRRAQWRWAAGMAGEGQGSVEHSGDNRGTCTEMLGQAILSVNHSLNAIH